MNITRTWVICILIFFFGSIIIIDGLRDLKVLTFKGQWTKYFVLLNLGSPAIRGFVKLVVGLLMVISACMAFQYYLIK